MSSLINVFALSPTLATAEVEQYISAPIEIAVKTIPGLVELRSINRFGLSVVTVVIEEDQDIWLARQQIAEKLREVEGRPARRGRYSGTGARFYRTGRGVPIRRRTETGLRKQVQFHGFADHSGLDRKTPVGGHSRRGGNQQFWRAA